MYVSKNTSQDSLNTELVQENKRLTEQVKQFQAEIDTLKKLQQQGNDTTLNISLYTYVEKNLDLSFDPHIRAYRVTEDKLIEAAEQSWIQPLSSHGVANYNFAFEHLGIIPVNQNLLTQLAMGEGYGAVAVYDVGSKEILIGQHYDEENIFHNANVVRALSIALLDQKFPAPNYQGIDSVIARKATLYGRASMISHRFQNKMSREHGIIKPLTGNEDVAEVYNSLPSLVRGIVSFPSTTGKSYVASLMQNHDKILPLLYKKPPLKTSTIYANKLPDGILPVSPVTPGTLISAPLGQLITKLYIQQLDAGKDTLHLQLDYDNLHLWQDPADTEKFIATWTTEWKTEEAAKDFYLYASELSVIPEDAPLVTIKGKTVTIKKQR